ncbi:solute carrier family 41 member 2 isoform X1 [Syngnathus scovelli]|uniref:solute carrier family 41 member 2 isoform X1 n=1 Tax=Syngnathus scovelli TaxID=161590 RepID=UPI0035CA4B57
MVFPESKGVQTSGSEEKRSTQNRVLPQHSPGPNYLTPRLIISPVNVTYEPQDYTETDPLLPSGTRFIGSQEAKISRGSTEVRPESVCSLVLQILVSFLLAGLGTISAGLLLDMVQNWDVFQEITEIFILLPVVLGMKGNLEMTLASRLSTAKKYNTALVLGKISFLSLDSMYLLMCARSSTVNAGKMELASEKWMLIIGNLAVKQLQSTILGLLASLMAIVLGWIADGRLPFNHVILLCSTSVCTTFVASLLQGIIMVGVIIVSKRTGINPDNVATPMAASFGDLITLALLACFSQWFYSFIDLYSYVLYLLDLLLLCLIPLWIVISSKHPASQLLLRTGWEPIITAMVISSMGGLILDKTVSDPNLAGIILYAPVINGIGGNLVSIQASRISTKLHMNFAHGEVLEDRKRCHQPCSTFFGSEPNHKSAKVLLLIVIPGQLIFLYAIHLIKGSYTMPSALFTFAFLTASLIQVFSLLCIADCMVHCLWRRGKDPDSYSIPYLTALGDLLGTALLSLAFLLLWWSGDIGGG